MLSIQKEVLNLVYPFQGADSCDVFLQHVTHKTQAAHLLVKVIHWLMHGDLEMLVGFLKLMSLPSICLTTTCVLEGFLYHMYTHPKKPESSQHNKSWLGT